MAKLKCDICNSEFDNFHAEGFDNKIYCPLCFYKHEFNRLQQENKELIKWFNDELKSLESMPFIISKSSVIKEFEEGLSKLKESDKDDC